MRYLVIYDITDDGLRKTTAEVLKNYGLRRIQKSAFVGDLMRDQLNSLVTDLKKMIVDDNLKIFPLCDPDYRRMISLGKEYVEPEEEKVAYF